MGAALSRAAASYPDGTSMKVARVLGLLVAALAALAVLSSPSPVHADHSDGEIIGFAFRLNTLLKDVVDEHAKSTLAKDDDRNVQDEEEVEGRSLEEGDRPEEEEEEEEEED